MARTRNELISDIELRIGGGSVNKEILLPRSFISHQLDLSRNEIVEEKIKANSSNQETLEQSCRPYIRMTFELQPEREIQTGESLSSNRWFVKCPTIPMNLPMDRGVFAFRERQSNTIIPYYDIKENEWLVDLPYSDPELNGRMSYYREGDRLYINGLRDSYQIATKTFDLHVVPSDISTLDNLNFEGEFFIEDDILDEMMERVEEKCLRHIDN